MRELRDMPDKGIPDDLWTRAECVVVIPNMKKAAFGTAASTAEMR